MRKNFFFFRWFSIAATIVCGYFVLSNGLFSFEQKHSNTHPSNDFSVIINKFPSSPVETIGVDNLRRGMLLYGLTRLADDKLVAFKAKILSIHQGDEQYGKKLMVEIITPPFKKLGIMQGMSGSPLYYQNKLVGALAYTMNFLKNPIGYVTPISDMKKMIDAYEKIVQANQSTRDEATIYLDRSPNIVLLEAMDSDTSLSHASIPSPTSLLSFVNDPSFLLQKLSFDNFSLNESPSSQEFISKHSQKKRQPETDQNTNIDPPASIHAGDAFAVSFVRGDTVLAGVGTVTEVVGDYLLTLGHTLHHLGSLQVPIYRCYVEATVPRWSLSFKVVSLKEEIGSVVLDHNMGMLGKLGARSEMIPLTITLSSTGRENEKSLRYEIVKHPNLFAEFSSILIFEALKNYHYLHKESIVYYVFEIKTDLQTVKIANSDFNKTIHIAEIIKSDIASILNILYKNYLGPIPIKEMNVKLKTASKRDLWSLKNVVLDKKHYRPNEEIKLKVEFYRYQKKSKWKSYSIVLPENIEYGVHQMSIGNALSLANINRELLAGTYPHTKSEILHYLSQDLSTTTLAIWLPSVISDSLRNAQGFYQDLTPYQEMLLIENNPSSDHYIKPKMLYYLYPEENIMWGDLIVDFNVHK